MKRLIIRLENMVKGAFMRFSPPIDFESFRRRGKDEEFLQRVRQGR